MNLLKLVDELNACRDNAEPTSFRPHARASVHTRHTERLQPSSSDVLKSSTCAGAIYVWSPSM
ncbi:MAG: hypothetical protein ACREMQ_10720, partial [Longimicrobiales bacterium]